MDATQYYGASNSPGGRKKKADGAYNQELKGECYIGFQKMLNEELRAFDYKDSFIFEMKLSESKGNKPRKSEPNIK